MSAEKPSLAIWINGWQQNDGIFNPDHPGNRDDTYYGYRKLRERLRALGWECHTQDVFQRAGQRPTAVLFPDLPRPPLRPLLGRWWGHVKTYGMLIESPLIRPSDWKPAKHGQFDRILTWHSALAGQKNYIRSFYTHNISTDVALDRNLSNKPRLCVMIAGNKLPRSNSPLELYSERLKVVKWYEKNHLDEFDLYGTGWDEVAFRYPGILRRFRLQGLAHRLFKAEFRPSYRGTVKAKRPVLAKYRFNICFENVRDLPGYITEKLFDTFLAGCIPVYWGASDIAEFVPEGCFLDFRKFQNLEQMHARISTMPDDEYLGYLDRIESFLRVASRGPFSALHWVDQISTLLVSDLQSAASA